MRSKYFYDINTKLFSKQIAAWYLTDSANKSLGGNALKSEKFLIGSVKNLSN